jgi:hypothetical protein
MPIVRDVHAKVHLRMTELLTAAQRRGADPG